MKICPVCSTEYPDDVRFCQNDGQTLRASSPAHDLGARSALTIDSALGRLVDLVVIPATAEEGRLRAQRYYEDAAVPTRLRAQAAFTVAQAYFIERRKDDECRWNGRALELAPGNQTYLKFQREGCP